MDTKQIPYASQLIDEQDIAAVGAALRAAWITRGPEVAAFEEAIAGRVQARYAVAFNSGTSALSAAYSAAAVGKGDKIFTSANTFIGTLSGGLQRGATAHFIDIDADTGLIDLNSLEREINSPATRSKEVIVPVHFAGVSVDVCALSSLVRRLDTVIIEDAAQALGSCDPQGNPVGSCAFSDMTIFSFHPSKTITTGEGGMVTTNDHDLYHRLILFRDNGIERDPTYWQQQAAPWHYEVVDFTGNYHMNAFQAALGSSQLKKMDRFIALREKLRTKYIEELAGVETLQILKGAPQTVCHLFIVKIDFSRLGISREEVMESLKKQGIGTQVHYIPLYRHPVFKTASDADFASFYPSAESYYASALTLPLHCQMDEKDVVRICQVVKELLLRKF